MTFATWLEHRAGEARFAVRTIGRTPGASAIAILSLALGIGANTAIFSIVDTLLLERLPVRAPEQLYLVAQRSSAGNAGARPGVLEGVTASRNVVWSYPSYREFCDATRAFAGLAAHSTSQAIGFQEADSGRTGAADLVQGSFVSGNYFEVLGVTAAAGRLFTARDERIGASPYVVLSENFWRRRLAGDPGVIGRAISLSGYPLTVIGVSQRGFRGTDPTTPPDLFVPIAMRSELFGIPVGAWNTRGYWWLQMTGRLAPAATTAHARTELTAVAQASTGQTSASRRWNVELLPAARGYSNMRNTLETPLLVLTGIVGVVLLIACANVAGLLLAKGAARQHEMAVRLAAGASRARLASQLLAESTMLGLMGGAAGLLFAYGCVQVLVAFVPRFGGLQATLDVTPDLRVLAFTLAASLATSLLFGLAPALQCTRPDMVFALRARTLEGGQRSRVTLRTALVVGQVALSLLLLVGAGLFVRTLQNLRDVDLGVRLERTLLVRVDPSRNGYAGPRLRDFYERLRAGTEQLPGVRSASLAQLTPLSGSRSSGSISVEGYTPRPGERVSLDFNTVGPRYFEALGIPLLLGRDFRDADSPATAPEPLASRTRPSGLRVAIVTESVARRFFGTRNAIGRRLCLQDTYDPAQAHEIVGVVKDVHYTAVRQAPDPMVYLPAWTEVGAVTLCLRTAADNATVVLEGVRRQLRAVDATVPLLRARTLQQDADNHMAVERLVATLSGFFGSLALLLASVGLYGLIACTVLRRTHEIGIRMALGARRTSVVWLVMREAAVLVLAGTALGLPAALLGTRVIAAFLYGVTTADPPAAAAAMITLYAFATLAALVPACRASRVEPMAALRCE